MQVERNKPVAGSETRRFTAGPSAPRAGGKSFAAALKQAASGQAPAPAAPDPARSGTAPAPAAGPSRAEAAAPATGGEAPSPPARPEGETPVSFADHMELVRYRLKTGYYDSKAIEDALTEKLSGYFDDLG